MQKKSNESNKNIQRILARLERLDELRRNEVINQDEYESKKIELLGEI